MLTRLSPRYSAVLLLAVLLAGSLAATLRGDQPVQLAAGELPKLAESGRFTQVLSALQAQPNVAADPQVAPFVQELQRYQTHSTEQAGKRRAAYDKALAAVAEKARAGKLDEALVSAVEAHSLADDPKATVKDPQVVALIQQAEAAATQAEKDGDWVEALNLYRIMEVMFEDIGRFREQSKRAERHVNLLRLYAPEELKRLLTERLQRVSSKDKDGKDKAPDPIILGDETWKDRLQGVELTMLRQTLAHAARRHVGGQGYAPLLLGALDAVLVMTDTKALATTFPAFNDQEQLAEFQAGLRKLRQEVDQQKNELNFLTASHFVDQVIELNGKTLKLDEAVLVYELADGAMSTLDDFSNVIWPREKSEFSRNTQGKFYGVGIQIRMKYDPVLKLQRLTVVTPLANTPARTAGIKNGDVIVSVDGQATNGWTLDQAVRRITGPEEGTEVALGIERAGQNDPLTFKIKRAEIIIESIRGWDHAPAPGGGWDYYIDPVHKIGYVRLTQFIPQSAADLDAAINQMDKAGGVNALILDLRFNPGGLLSSAIEVANRFIQNGPIVSTVNGQGEMTSEAKARPEHTYPNFPLVVLVNEGSASASEIVSGAVQDYGRAIIVGTRSFGKGSVQDLFPIDDNKAYLKLTTQYYRLPKGRIIHRKPDSATWGIQPDLEVKMTGQQITDAIEYRQDVDILRDPKDAPATQPAPVANQLLEKGLDPQLETALLLLKTKLVADHITVARGQDKAAEAATR